MEITKEPKIMELDPVGLVSYTDQLRAALLDEFERSGLKGRQFALAARASIRPSPTGCSNDPCHATMTLENHSFN